MGVGFCLLLEKVRNFIKKKVKSIWRGRRLLLPLENEAQRFSFASPSIPLLVLLLTMMSFKRKEGIFCNGKVRKYGPQETSTI